MITVKDILNCERYLKDIDAVIFDLDDTLYSEKDYVRSGYAAVAKIFPQIARMEDKLWEAFLQNNPAIDCVLEQERLFTFENKEKALCAYRTHLPSISLYPGVAELLLRLKKTKKLGLITDGRPEGQHLKIAALNISRYFQKIIVTDELGGTEFRKPNKKAFVMMQMELQVPFERMIYIGDNRKKDFIAPQKLGMKSCFFANPDGLYVDE